MVSHKRLEEDMKTKLLTIILGLALLTGCIAVVFSQSAERRPRPIPPSCCNPFRTEEVTNTDMSAVVPSHYHSRLPDLGTDLDLGRVTNANVGSPVGGSNRTPASTPVILEPEEIEIYRLNLEQYRLTTQLQKRKGLISQREYEKRMWWYNLRTNQYKRLNP